MKGIQVKAAGTRVLPSPARPEPPVLQRKVAGAGVSPPPVRWPQAEGLQMKQAANAPASRLPTPPRVPSPHGLRPQAASGPVVQKVQTLITQHFPTIRKIGEDFYAYLLVNGVQTEVSRLELADYDDDGNMWLMYVITPAQFQRRGYAAMLMRAAVAEHGAIYVSQAGQQEHEQRDDDDTRWLTDDGAAFVNRCVAKGILQQQWLVNPFWQEEDFDDYDQ